jgi:type III secretory pathway component EscT
LLGLAVGTQIEGATAVHVARVVIEEIGIGAAIGLALTWLTTFDVALCRGARLD